MLIISKQTHTFSKDNPPAAYANPGECLLFQTLDCFNGQIGEEAQLVHHLDLTKANPAAGPVYIKGAEAGDVLAVDLLDIRVGEAGVACTLPQTGPLHGKSEVRTRLLPIRDGYAYFNDVQWPVEPMIGVIGTAPATGSIGCGYAGNFGGNIDSKLIKKGARVYLPVRVEGALLQMGDLHASMGDGEICGTGIEIAGEALVRTSLIKRFALNWPVTETFSHWFVNVTAANYDAALEEAANELCRLMQPVYDWDITDLFIYLSLQADVAINQGTRPMYADMLNIRMGIPKLSGKGPLIA